MNRAKIRSLGTAFHARIAWSLRCRSERRIPTSLVCVPASNTKRGLANAAGSSGAAGEATLRQFQIGTLARPNYNTTVSLTIQAQVVETCMISASKRRRISSLTHVSLRASRPERRGACVDSARECLATDLRPSRRPHGRIGSLFFAGSSFCWILACSPPSHDMGRTTIRRRLNRTGKSPDTSRSRLGRRRRPADP